MDTIENIATLKTTDIKRIELARKKLKITGAFISRCLGLSDTSWSGWVTQTGKIPEKYMDQVVNIFIATEALQDGRKVLPVGQTNGPSKDYSLVKDFLLDMIDPRISIFKDELQAYKELVSRQREEAQILLDLLENE